MPIVLFSGSSAAEASGSTAYQWEAGAGAVCGVEPTACPDVAMADNGDTISVRAMGNLDTADGSASGGGFFWHRNSSGQLIASGTITASRLIVFNAYGCLTAPSPTNLCGGRAALVVHLVGHPAGDPSATVEANGILEVECLIGSPPSGAHEGIRLNVQDVITFNKSVRGDTLFIKS
ncbi:MAG TPA: hypothetical protein VHO95_10710 [Candidatus Dormibacteraeota bacterium]|nr:hypothetical protein [Candidatus Dormibacteraeota bacterium]